MMTPELYRTISNYEYGQGYTLGELLVARQDYYKGTYGDEARDEELLTAAYHFIRARLICTDTTVEGDSFSVTVNRDHLMKLILEYLDYNETEYTLDEILKLPKINEDAGSTTIGGFLESLLYTLWNEGADFNSKRPWGNSGWEYVLYEALVEHGVVEGKLDEDGFIEKVDYEKANEIVFGLIKHVFK